LLLAELGIGFVAALYELVSILSFVVAIAALVAFLLWFYRANRNLRVLGGTDLRFTPGWAVVWWFIPIANIWMPYRATVEIAKASDPSVGVTNRQSREQLPRPKLLLVWWLYSLLSGLAYILILASAGLWTPFMPGRDSTENVAVAVGGAAITAVSLWLTILVIRMITDRQSQKSQAIRSSTQ
jgi:hypothetical protein